MTSIVKIGLGSGIALMGLLGLSLTLAGCSGESAKPIEEVKINKMSPGEYLDSLDPQPKAKSAKGSARPKR